jgi:hypothetical protein
MLLLRLTTVSITLFSLLISIDSLSQKGQDKKNNKILKAENERYEKDIREHPNSAEPHGVTLILWDN